MALLVNEIVMTCEAERENLIITGGPECHRCAAAACLGLFSEIDFSAYCSLRQFNEHSLRRSRRSARPDPILLHNLLFFFTMWDLDFLTSGTFPRQPQKVIFHYKVDKM